MTDFLTGLDNRKSFDNALVNATHEAVGNNRPLCLLLVDIDYFKTFNDQHGHLIGDEVIKFVAQKMKELVRGKDIVARFGGEEFSLLLSQTSLSGASAVAENIRSYFSASKLKTSQGKVLGNITVSVGAACYRHNEPLEDFINRADRALYNAKKLGRNRITLETELA
jgi:diguanylate cyclase